MPELSYVVPMGTCSYFSHIREQWMVVEPPQRRLIAVKDFSGREFAVERFFVELPWMCYVLLTDPVYDSTALLFCWSTLKKPSHTTACYKCILPNISHYCSMSTADISDSPHGKLGWMCFPNPTFPCANIKDTARYALTRWWDSTFNRDLSELFRRVRKFGSGSLLDRFARYEQSSQREVFDLARRRPLRNRGKTLLVPQMFSHSPLAPWQEIPLDA